MMKKISLLVIFLLFIQCDILPTNNPVYGTNSSNSTNESGEFKTLLEKDLINKKQVNAEVLTYLLNDPNPVEKNTAAVFENQSRCNIIIRMVGISNNKIYNLPISANSKNQFVIEKGNYTLKSKICDANFYSQKNISKPLVFALSSN
jgi:hypothetical protein